MKKVRITVKKGSKGKKFQIFNSPESLYVWLNDPELQAEERVDPSLGMTISLKQGETMEVEWLGCEFIDDSSFSTRVNLVRLGKHIAAGKALSKKIVGIHHGWVVDEIIPFKNSSDDDIKVSKLTDKSKHKFDLEKLFVDKNENYDFEMDMNNLN